MPKDSLISYKDYFTLSDLDRAKEVIAYEKDYDCETAKTWAECAINEAHFGCIEKIFEASAEIAKNCRAWNAYTDNSGDMDVWITATAKTSEGFIEIGAYLTDIWQTGAVEYRHHMYVKTYKN